jgi:hypothetical protein
VIRGRAANLLHGLIGKEHFPMTRRTLTSLLAVATMTIACGGAPETTEDEIASTSPSGQEVTAPATTDTPASEQPPEAQQSTAAAADRPDALPSTASPLALIALGGLLSLGGALGIRMLRS